MLAMALIVLGSWAALSFVILRDAVRDRRRRKMIVGKCCMSDHSEKCLHDLYPVSKDLLSISKKYEKDWYMPNKEKIKKYSNRKNRKDTDVN